ncbi:hypothetical protein TREMEDRAFT_64430 [Tremella mesenterica DSM 1558]|uniref:uncharacterized protein n=1 Tax=Tremella mesenterica (strain ATCC 24925 / CBS 8224 / DSM 1558 / NBRC 9311 / NRRL Y-6157 / RJB 2259-6 / UBC 559-6) TaxID=578456 RepID=UPI0003F49692|nr:uncharacterized protein TREMEDRAFT_64430 [Tremella mesenterica DSM 1558]EIW67190.1 hypothetical protein TREMEDRAFT_64430 [Tremella mesenterica DSM 1558]
MSESNTSYLSEKSVLPPTATFSSPGSHPEQEKKIGPTSPRFDQEWEVDLWMKLAREYGEEAADETTRATGTRVEVFSLFVWKPTDTIRDDLHGFHTQSCSQLYKIYEFFQWKPVQDASGSGQYLRWERAYENAAQSDHAVTEMVLEALENGKEYLHDEYLDRQVEECNDGTACFMTTPSQKWIQRGCSILVLKLVKVEVYNSLKDTKEDVHPVNQGNEVASVGGTRKVGTDQSTVSGNKTVSAASWWNVLERIFSLASYTLLGSGSSAHTKALIPEGELRKRVLSEMYEKMFHQKNNKTVEALSKCSSSTGKFKCHVTNHVVTSLTTTITDPPVTITEPLSTTTPSH